MADDKIKHQHTPNDIIIKDQDGTYKILRDGKFVPLDEAEAKMHHVGPKRDPSAQAKPVAPKPAPAKPAQPVSVPVKTVPQPKPVVAVRQQASAAPASAVPAPAAPKKQDDATAAQAEEILRKTNLTFASGEVRSRVKNVLISHLKGLRKPFETKQYLMKGVREAGAGLTEQEAELILMAASGHKVLAAASKDKPEPPTAKPIIPVGKEVSVPTVMPADHAVLAPAEMPKMPRMEAAQPVGPAFAPKTSLADVQKPMRSLGGPIDQLSYDLMTWRRLAADPKDRIRKIETQLDVLEQDGYPERLKGLLTWHDSEVVRKYIDIGKKSIESKIPVQQILGSGSDTELSYAEWQAIADLNARIRP